MQLLLSLVALVGLAVGQDCGGELTTSFTCMKDGMMEMHKKSPMSKIDHDKFEGDLMKCFPE